MKKIVLGMVAVCALSTSGVVAADLPGACKVDADLQGAVHYNGAVVDGKALALNGDAVQEFPIAPNAGVIGTGAAYTPTNTPDGNEVDLVVQNGNVVCVAMPETVDLENDQKMAELAKPDPVQ